MLTVVPFGPFSLRDRLFAGPALGVLAPGCGR